ncbi:hypothetical protein CORC01_00704 [Colletotrichum orchidophilum]|uniref:Uncharacterized protein n=1 Tax=Colletotrichum orchidophilum TaxID=1209926 RepID=A0A1G4BQY5_9PEZI|nr:uncharacterized protein CORC01_00704 [Colletotrichum orchidophilum]OHF03842.1 hypothetical protein CORC01_00704 [Colletotrichum orchidophilum]
MAAVRNVHVTVTLTGTTDPDMTSSEPHKGTASPKSGYGSSGRSHRRDSASSKINGCPPVDEVEETVPPSTSGSPPRSNKSSKSSASINSSKRHKASSGKSSKKSRKSVRAKKSDADE